MSAWKPGDVAMRSGVNGESDISFVVQAHGSGDCESDHGREPHWHHARGGWNTIPDDEKWGTYRPLLVIDPEDREQVERLCKVLVEAMHAAGDRASAANGVHPATVAIALRSLLTPPSCRASLKVRLTDRVVGASCHEPAGHEGSHCSEQGTTWDATEAKP